MATSLTSFKQWLESLRKPPPVKAKYDLEKDLKYFGGNHNKVLERDNFTCQSCDNKRHLVVHHKDYRSLFNKYPFIGGVNNDPDNLITLCYFCHNAIHNREPSTAIDAIKWYFAKMKGARVKTEHYGVGELLQNVSGGVMEVKLIDGSIRMFLLDDLYIEENYIEAFMANLKDAYSNYCYNCGEIVFELSDERCPKCGWFICGRCGSCGCGFEGIAEKRIR